jgi:hypothetical protein
MSPGRGGVIIDPPQSGVMAGATHATPKHSTTTLTRAERAAVTALMRAEGIRRAHLRLGIARHAMERAAGGLTIQRGTAALIRAALAVIVQS